MSVVMYTECTESFLCPFNFLSFIKWVEQSQELVVFLKSMRISVRSKKLKVGRPPKK